MVSCALGIYATEGIVIIGYVGGNRNFDLVRVTKIKIRASACTDRDEESILATAQMCERMKLSLGK